MRISTRGVHRGKELSDRIELLRPAFERLHGFVNYMHYNAAGNGPRRGVLARYILASGAVARRNGRP